jgi:hypothetical protein
MSVLFDVTDITQLFRVPEATDTSVV